MEKESRTRVNRMLPESAIPRLARALWALGMTAAAALPAASQETSPEGPSSYYVYVAAESEDRVDLVRFDGTGASVLDSVFVGRFPTEIDGPHGLAVDPSGERWYVTLAHGNPFGTVVAYSTATNRPVGISVSEEIAAEGGSALPVVMNLRDAESITGAVDQVIAEWGRIDILVNNAAIFIPGDIVGARERHIELSIAINLVGPIIAMRAVVPHMREAGGGHIINVSSRGSIMPGVGPYTDDQIARVGDLLYGPEKSGLEHFSQSQAVELQDDNIAVNVLSPESGYRTPGLIFAGNDPENPDLNFEAADPMGEATVWVCQQEPSGYTGNILYDRSVLAQA